VKHLDGAAVTRPLDLTADVVVVGSGPAGSSAARELARAGARVLVVEAGPWVRPDEHPLSAFGAMSRLYRDMGASVVLGGAPIPYLQARMVGGSSPINGAICWRMPRDVWDEWCAADPALHDALPWREIEALTDEIEARLGVAPTDPAIAGRKNLLMADGAAALGLEHRPIRRNVRGCTGLGRCLQGCPHGFKQSADVALLADALAHETTLLSNVEACDIVRTRGRAEEICGRASGGGAVRLRARHAIVLAASAIQTPVLLLRNRITHGPVGEHFQCHPGVSLAGRFRDPVRMWEGATQGHEVIGLRHEGLKFEALGFDLTVLAARLDGVGRDLARSIADMAHWLDWGAAVRAEARGRVRSVLGRPVVTFTPSSRDVRRFRRGLRVLGEMMLAAGAEEVHPGVRGFAPRVTSRAALEQLEQHGPTRPGAYTAAITHMFGTCRMGREPRTSVVRPDFRHHAVDGLWIADSSVFPTSLGVNPQIPIMALAAMCARRVLAATAGARTTITPAA
jgi:choline dehydrogenase-like flavoprotein